MIKFIFQWLDFHPGSYWIMAEAATLLLLARLGWLMRREVRAPASSPGKMWPDAAVLFLLLLAWRWPFLLVSNEYNPDESQMIAGALTLGHDPVFWRSVDGGSSGPFNYYLLLPWHWIGAPLDYFTARVTCILLTWGALFASFRALARLFSRAVAWLAILPATAFFATVTHPELTNLSTENLPLLLIAVVFGLLAGRADTDRLRLWAAFFFAGALPWTKLQSAPIGLALMGWGCWQVLTDTGVVVSLRWRRVGQALLAAALPTLLLAVMVAVTGQAEAAWRRYFLQNFQYIGEGGSSLDALGALWRNARIDGRFPLLLGTVAIGQLAAVVYFFRHRMRPSGLLLAAIGVSLAAIAAVITPHREFLHYVLLLPVPLTFCLGAALGDWWRKLSTVRSRVMLAGVFLLAGLLPLITRSMQAGPPVYGTFALHWRSPRSGAAAVLHALAGRDDTLGIWGWACYLHAESGLRQATRDGTTLYAIAENPQRAYYRTVYLADLKKSAPAVFADAVGQGAFVFSDRSSQAHESFPELAEYIQQNYTFVVDLQDVRVYARNGLPALPELSPARLRQLIAHARKPEIFLMSLPSTPLEGMQKRLIGQRRVLMLLPPARVEWPLDDEVREVSLEFGFDPAAYGPGRSNGANIFLEVVSPGYTRRIFQRFLDPARQPGDRGLLSARLRLPPFTPDSMLVVRTDPGPSRDTAWDWVYLASLQLHRSPDPDPR